MITNALISTVAMLEITLKQIKPFPIAEPIYIESHLYYDNPVIEIPKINLKKGFLDVNDKDNNWNNAFNWTTWDISCYRCWKIKNRRRYSK